MTDDEASSAGTAARSERARVIAAFDFDKTLTDRDNVGPFLVAAVGRARVSLAALRIAPRLAAAALDDARRDDAKAALVRHTLSGYDAARLVTVAQRVADEIFERHLRRDVVERVQWHRSQGHELVVISASFRHYVAPVATRLGFDAVLATDLEVGADGRLTGALAGPNVRGAEKVRRLDAWLRGEDAFVWAYGDSRGDGELLDRADRGVLVGRHRRRL